MNQGRARGQRSGETSGPRAGTPPDSPLTPCLPPPPREARRTRPRCSPSGNTPVGSDLTHFRVIVAVSSSWTPQVRRPAWNQKANLSVTRSSVPENELGFGRRASRAICRRVSPWHHGRSSPSRVEGGPVVLWVHVPGLAGASSGPPAASAGPRDPRDGSPPRKSRALPLLWHRRRLGAPDRVPNAWTLLHH